MSENATVILSGEQPVVGDEETANPLTIEVMTRPCARRFFRKVGATIQSSAAIDLMRKLVLENNLRDLIYMAALVVKNGKRKVIQLVDFELALEMMGIQLAKWKEIKLEYQASLRPSHKTVGTQPTPATDNATVDDANESDDDAVIDTNSDGKSLTTSKTTSTRHTRTGTVARREVKRLHMNNRMLIRHAGFKRAVQATIRQLFPESDDETIKFSRPALVMLQVLVESSVCKLLKLAFDATVHADRKEVSVRDVQFAWDHLNDKYI